MGSTLEQELRLRGYSDATVKAYLLYNTQFEAFLHPRDAEQATKDDIKAFLGKQLTEKQTARRSLGLMRAAICFHQKEVLGKDIGKLPLPQDPTQPAHCAHARRGKPAACCRHP
ncbi:MAG: site-specific integrase [Nitrosarchaeum sp.]|nr:site-specific integrase [Nitrosarchaeum sp.]